MRVDEMIADEKKLEQVVTKFIRSIGIPLHINGYEYLRTAIMLVMVDYTKFDSVTKILYPEVAKIHHTTPSRVERSIRHAIEVAWSNMTPGTAYELFGDSGQVYSTRPTNSEFISLATDNIRVFSLS